MSKIQLNNTRNRELIELINNLHEQIRIAHSELDHINERIQVAQALSNEGLEHTGLYIPSLTKIQTHQKIFIQALNNTLKIMQRNLVII